MENDKATIISVWYNAIAPFYPHVWPFIVPSYNEITNHFIRILSASKQPVNRILDLGCGPGLTSQHIIRRFPHARFTLIDVSNTMLNMAKHGLGPTVESSSLVDYGTDSFETYPEPAYDVIIAFFSLHHLPQSKLLALYPKLHSLLKDNGTLFIAEEVVTDAPGGKDIVAAVRKEYMETNRRAGMIPPEFIQVQQSIPQEKWPKFHFQRVEDHASMLARAGFAVATPIISLGSALFIANKSKL